MTENAVGREIVDVAFRLHSAIGPGLFESVYEAIQASELEKRDLPVSRQQSVPVVYEGTRFEMGFRADLVVDEKVIVEVKSVSAITAVHKQQLLTYLRLSDKDGIARNVNGLEE